MIKKTKSAITAFLISSLIYTSCVLWIISDVKLGAPDKFLICFCYIVFIGLATAAGYDLTENK